ncbi:MAG: pyridine nucleotide-disulfide oxidoreductase [Gammaproteobacteria bacterium PRO9]|nr:pyridine nucleotide-disulfide oxidoreductase [Gammaproteobacteria bacterium PRO9]
MKKTVVIAGAGHAAGQSVVSLRQGGFDGRIVLVGEEPYLPYQRPPLSKKFLAGELDASRLLLRQEKFYVDHDVDVRLGTRVTRIDHGAHTAELGDCSTLHYDKLILATGSRARKVGVTGHDLHGIHYLRTIEDVDRIRDRFQPGTTLVIVGAGYIGLEVAAVAVSRGLKVTVVELADQVMARVRAPEVSTFMERIHRAAGVDIRCGTGVAGFSGISQLSGVLLANGEQIPADMAIVGVGIVPNVELAEVAGIPCNNGILCDEHCLTADPDILAIGDCSNHPNSLLGYRVRLESVHKYDLKLQIAGFSSTRSQAVVRGDPDSRSLAVFYLDEGRLVAVYAINSPREFMLSKKLIAAGVRPDPALLRDTGIPFPEIAAGLETTA